MLGLIPSRGQSPARRDPRASGRGFFMASRPSAPARSVPDRRVDSRSRVERFRWLIRLGVVARHQGSSRSPERASAVGSAVSCVAAGASVRQDIEAVPFRVENDVASFEDFYAKQRDSVARTLAFAFNDPELGFEAADEAMVRAYRAWPEVSGYENPEGWVFRVGLNWGRSSIRRRFTATMKAPMVAAERRTESIEDLAADTDLAAAIASLKRDHRVVVALRFQRDYSIAQIADVLGIAEGTVKSRLSRALKRLGAILAATESEERS